VDEKALKQHLLALYPKEDEDCEWKEYKNLKNCWNSRKGDDVESYVSAIANMEGGHLVLGVKDKTLDIVGIQEFGDYNVVKRTLPPSRQMLRPQHRAAGDYPVHHR
jgi:ATP-dependent DNA helicase RecG